MKILIISDFLKWGGAENQMLSFYKYLLDIKMEVRIFTFDQHYEDGVSLYGYNISKKGNKLTKWTNKILINYYNYRKLSSYILKEKITHIYMNNVFLNAPTVYKVCSKYKNIQVCRDYSYVCPKGTSIFTNGQVCISQSFIKCSFTCKLLFSKKILDLLVFYIQKKQREKCISKFISPSSSLANRLAIFNKPIEVINNPSLFHTKNKVIIDKLKLVEIKLEKRTILYFGVISSNKGVDKLIDAFINSRVSDEYTLILVGDIDVQFKYKTELLDSEKMLYHSIKYFSAQPHEKMSDFINNSSFVFIPSLWMENYPNTILESIANCTMVFASNRGGIPEIVNKPELLFDPTNINDIRMKIEYAVKIDAKTYLGYLDEAYEIYSTQEQYNKYVISFTNL